jgi:hypothetical protein
MKYKETKFMIMRYGMRSVAGTVTADLKVISTELKMLFQRTQFKAFI